MKYLKKKKLRQVLSPEMMLQTNMKVNPVFRLNQQNANTLTV